MDGDALESVARKPLAISPSGRAGLSSLLVSCALFSSCESMPRGGVGGKVFLSSLKGCGACKGDPGDIGRACAPLAVATGELGLPSVFQGLS